MENIRPFNITTLEIGMKITFDHNTPNQNVDRATTAYRNTRMPKTERTGNYALDISGTVMDNNAYKGHGKTAEEVMQDAGLIDVATQRDYMTVMSNTMSEEDFRRLQRDGYHPGNMEIKEVVTIVDKIKAELIKGGTQVAGYTDDLDAETLKQITGSEAFARELYKQFRQHDIPLTPENVASARQAYDRAMELQTPDDGTAKYMVENRMEPTIDELYRAGYSSTADNRQSHGYYAEDSGGYYAKKAEEYNWEQLQPQMAKVLEEAGLEVTEENLAEAQWIIESGIPLTPESVSRLHEIRQVAFPQDMEQILSAVAAAIADGHTAGKANLADGRSNLEKAVDYAEAYERISDEAVDQTASEGKEPNLRNLQNTQEQIDRYGVADWTTEQISARHQLEEVRLMMTIEANRMLLESGFSIDTAELEKLVEELKRIMEDRTLLKVTDFPDAVDTAALYEETQQKVAEIPYLPAAVLAVYVSEEELFTLGSVHESGTALKNAYEAARESYETLMTAPRADMGDSIRKAFRNVDDILTDMGLETSEENRRAVRILGYNSMDITGDNMDAVKKYDMELRQVIRRMTPAATLQAIREGRNPLSMSIEELNKYLDDSDLEVTAKEEKFSKYLYKLEKNHDISEQEREAYIGIYRMFRQLEKTDDAAVGSLLKEGAQLTFSNLLTAMRSARKQGMDYTVNDAFNGVDGVSLNKSITEQILSGFSNLDPGDTDEHAASEQQGRDGARDMSGYYNRLAGEIADGMEPEMLNQMEIRPDMTMEEFADELYRMSADEQLEEAYLREQVQQFNDLHEVEDAVIKELLAYRQPITADHVAAASQLRKNSGLLFKKLNEIDKSADKNKVKDAASHLLNKLTDKNSAVHAYDDMRETFDGMLEEAQEESVSYLDLRTLQSCRKQLSLAGNLAGEENYQIPVEVHGELTAINLKILHGGEEGGKVTAAMDTETYGRVTAQFHVKNHTVSGYIACDSEDGAHRLQEKEKSFKEALFAGAEGTEHPFKEGSIGIIYSKESNVADFTGEEAEQSTQIETADLYRIAKAFITSVTA